MLCSSIRYLRGEQKRPRSNIIDAIFIASVVLSPISPVYFDAAAASHAKAYCYFQFSIFSFYRCDDNRRRRTGDKAMMGTPQAFSCRLLNMMNNIARANCDCDCWKLFYVIAAVEMGDMPSFAQKLVFTIVQGHRTIQFAGIKYCIFIRRINCSKLCFSIWWNCISLCNRQRNAHIFNITIIKYIYLH